MLKDTMKRQTHVKVSWRLRIVDDVNPKNRKSKGPGRIDHYTTSFSVDDEYTERQAYDIGNSLCLLLERFPFDIRSKQGPRQQLVAIAAVQQTQ